jgi:hypothetical protein
MSQIHIIHAIPINPKNWGLFEETMAQTRGVSGNDPNLGSFIRRIIDGLMISRLEITESSWAEYKKKNVGSGKGIVRISFSTEKFPDYHIKIQAPEEQASFHRINSYGYKVVEGPQRILGISGTIGKRAALNYFTAIPKVLYAQIELLEEWGKK